ncbi:MAG: hypothetical protein JWQ84_1759 [Mucilaginibacter sp.]|nr:hypothetical protein [Mucilaginibacter sp.]
MTKNHTYFFSLLTLIIGCKKTYNPVVTATNYNYLVIEGSINTGQDSTIITLSRTVTIASQTALNPELAAQVSVENNQSNVYLLKEMGKGRYAIPALNLDTLHKYRLRVKTSDGKEYLSDYVTILNAPPIDTISYSAQSNGLNIYSATHDPTNKIKYYRWDYQETWQFHSTYFSYFKSNGDTVLARDLVNDNVYSCWQSDTSSTILLGSTAKLSRDIIVDNPITFIASTAEKLGTKYSILVKQYALTADAYSFYQNIKKNTEQLGSIFSAQPSEIPGNIHCITNLSEPVIGYISAGAVSSKRIFITNRQLPNWLPVNPYPNCILDTALYEYFPPGSKGPPINQVNEFINFKKAIGNILIPVSSLTQLFSPKIIGYTAAQRECVDCTIRGTNKQPAFWK